MHIEIVFRFFKIGVNGYSFIVDNNGHVLYHPDLRPLVSISFSSSEQIQRSKLFLWFQRDSDNYDENLEPKYISVDLAELELVVSENGPRENNTVLLDVSNYSLPR